MPNLMRRGRWLAVALAMVVFGLAVGLSAGLAQRRPDVPQSPATAEIDQLRIAFVERLGSNAPPDRVLPALHGVELAVEAATTTGDLPVGVELVRIDPWADPGMLERLLDDPGYVAAIGAPYLSGQLSLGEQLDDAGLPFVTLSTYGPRLSSNGWEGWFRGVANVAEEATTIAGWLDSSGFAAADVCLVGDHSPGTAPLFRAIAAGLDGRAAARVRLGPDVATNELAERVRRAGCDAVVWGGDGLAGGDVASALAGRRSRPLLVGGSNLRDPAFVDAAGAAARGILSASSVAELTTSTGLAAQRFIQDYQSQFARPPGPFAVEGWDVARWLLRGIEAGAVTRSGLLGELLADVPFDGLAGTYDFGPDGEPTGEAAAVALWRFQAGRWLRNA